jgi:tetratricopeptide (TPR) repeat protein
MKLRYATVVFCGALALFCFCQKDTGENKKVVKIGSSVFCQKDIDAFSRVTQNYPTSPAEFALTARAPVTSFIETKAIYQKERFSPANLKYRKSLDWQWKKRFMTSLNYMTEVLQKNLGYAENDLRTYYDAHKSEFMNTVRSDSGGKADSTKVVSPFDAEVKRQIAEKLFLKDYPIDSSFTAQSAPGDTAGLKNRWVQYMRNQGFRDYFLKKTFKDKYGKALPDSLGDLLGAGKVLSQADMDVILSWIPADRREAIKNDKKTMYDFALWLLRWRLFSEKAVAIGLASQPQIKDMVKWSWRLEVAQRYCTDKLASAAKKAVHIDSAMARYSYWDDNGNPGVVPDTTAIKDHYAKLISQQVSENFDGLLYAIRHKANVRFLTKEWTDDRGKNPSDLMHRADSLRDTGATSEAESAYRTLVSDFASTPEGKKAIVELAKLQTEQQAYAEAIRNYRRVLITDADAGKRCNFMFMIGFIYDEYLDRPEMAECNYKWVLKNAPDCELADDAEFMMLHLGEQMSSVDELQAEVKRQGKKVEASEADSTGLTVETETGKEKAKK